jgi:DNA (cytosine-5)-methyltransferase 1
MVYYNEIDPFAAAWLRELIKCGHIAPGIVDERSIKEIKPDELKGYAQHHFFAGIGVWSYALRQAGWPDDRPVWTGSCPCPSFSAAGKGGGFNDPRHLWPDWFRLIRECKPATIFGEQVSASIGYGWLDLVQTDLEAQDYAIGKAVLGAASVGAPHIRQRLYFVADNDSSRFGTGWASEEGNGANASRIKSSRLCDAGELEQSSGQQMGLPRCTWFDGRPSDWIFCKDEKYRLIEPGTFPLAHGVAGRVGRLRGYGNALCGPVAEAFIKAFMDTKGYTSV